MSDHEVVPGTKKRTRRKKGTVKWVTKKVHVPKEDVKDAENEKQHAHGEHIPNKHGFATIDDLPNELICLILDNLKMLDYRKYRVLRLSKALGAIMDTRFMVFLYDKGGKTIYKPPSGASVGKFKDLSEFTSHAKGFANTYRLKLSDLTVYVDFAKGIHDNPNALATCQLLAKYCSHTGIHLSLIVNSTQTSRLLSNVPGRTKLSNIEVIEKVGPSGVLGISRSVKEQSQFKLYEFVEEMTVITKAPEAVKSLFSGETVYWKNSIQTLKDMVFLHENNKSVYGLMQVSQFKTTLLKLDLRSKDITKVTILKIDGLDLPNLTHFNSWLSLTKSFSNNRLPNLIQAHIEDVDRKEDYRLKNDGRKLVLNFTNNYLPKLKTLMLSTSDVEAITFSDTENIPKLDKMRLEFRSLNTIGNLIHFMVLLKQTKHLSLMTKSSSGDPTRLLTDYVSCLEGSLELVSLSVNCMGAKCEGWLEKLQSTKFPNLETLRLYNLDCRILESFQTPKLKTLVLMGSHEFLTIETVVIRNYPVSESIYLRLHSGKSNYSDTIYHFCIGNVLTSGPPTTLKTFPLTPDVRVKSGLSDVPFIYFEGGRAGSSVNEFVVYDIEEARKHSGAIRLAHHKQKKERLSVVADDGWYIQR